MQNQREKDNLEILCLSFWTPPIVRPQSILIGKMIPEWIRQEAHPIIVTYDICGKWNIGASVHTVPPHKNKHRFWSLPLLRLVSEYLYYRKLYSIGKKIAKKNQVNIVFSFSNPQSSNVMGAMMRKRLGTPFVAYMSDPWYDNHYKALRSLGAWKTYYMERFVIKWADKIIFPSEACRKLVMKKYPQNWQEKSLVIPHCFDPLDYPQAKKENTGKYIVSYIGAFYKERNPEPLFKALEMVRKEKPEVFAKIQIQLVGAENPYAGYSKEALGSMIDKYGLQKSTLIFPSVEYKKSLEFMVNSDSLVVIDANIPESPYLPSKVIDYAGSKTRIIAITPKKSPTAIVTEGLGWKSFSYDEIEELAKHIIQIVENSSESSINDTYLRQFHVEETTKKLLQEIKKIK